MRWGETVGPKEFLGTKILTKRDFLGSMKEAEVF